MNIFTGCVENRNDPLKLGRCQVRIVGLHTDDKLVLPTEDLPWAYPMQPVTSAAINGIGWTPIGPVPGTWVVVVFRDEDQQHPIMIGTVGGIPQSKAAERVIDNSDTVATDGGIVMNSLGLPLKSKDGSNLTLDASIKNTIAGASATVNKVLTQIGNLLGISIPSIGGSQVETTSPAIGANDADEETITPKIVKPSTKIADQPEPGKAEPEVLAQPIPIEPPAKYFRGSKGEARKAIESIIKYCDKMGFTSKYSKCAILAIAGGESGWAPLDEGYSYSADALRSVFKSVFKDQPQLADTYARWKGSREDFFKLIYSPKYKPGKELGNLSDEDGGRFYGRGFIQLTGRGGYQAVQKQLKEFGINIDIVSNPSILTTDVDACAAASVAFYKMKQKERILKGVAQDDPNFIEAALKATGHDAVVAGVSGYDKKRKIYQYFLGQGVISDSTNKPIADQDQTYTKEEVASLPEHKQLALLEDRSDAKTVGFRDPSGKYPLRNLVDEPDTNRLARGVIQETAIAFKDQTRTKGIPTANDNHPEWEQPLAPFGGQYPYSKVFESESGHLQVFDDTPGHEMISLYHRKGTFIDVDANGTQVNKIVGDGYTIIDRNGFVQVSGRCTIYVGNDASIKVDGSADIEVNGKTTATFHNDVDIGCATNVNMSVGADFNLDVNGNYNVNVAGNITCHTDSNASFQATGNMTTIVDGTENRRVNGDIFTKSNGNINTQTSAGVSTKSGQTFKVEAGGEIGIKSDAATKVTGQTLHLKASGGNVNVDGVQFRGQQGSAVSAGSAATVGVVEKFVPQQIDPPEPLVSSGNNYEVLTTPVRPTAQVEIKAEILSQNQDAVDDYMKNPSKYETAESKAAGIGAVRPQPNSGDDPESVPGSSMPTGDLQIFLKKQVELAKEGFWSETGMTDKTKSNKNILAIWKDIGLESVCGGTDQTAWCMAFVVWTLKQNGYRYCKTAAAADITNKTDKFGATRVTGDVQPGDIVHWRYGSGNHVNFVYEVLPNGNFTLVGGNQTDKNVKNNNPSGGSVTISWPNGTSKSNSQIVGIYRPGKN